MPDPETRYSTSSAFGWRCNSWRAPGGNRLTPNPGLPAPMHRLCGPDAVLGDQPSHIHVDPSPLWYSSTRLRTLHGHFVRVLVHGPVHSVLPLSLTAVDATVRNGAHVGQQAQSNKGRARS